MPKGVDIYGGKDPRDLPLYTIGQAAHYLNVHTSTVRAWSLGQKYLPLQGRQGEFAPLIKVAGSDAVKLSFHNLTELYVLSVLRRSYKLDLKAIRRAVANVKRISGNKHPLLDERFATDGVRIYIEELDRLLEVSTGDGTQYAIPSVIRDGLERIERDASGILRFFPFARWTDEDRAVVIDPRISFGKPTVVNSGVKVAVLADLQEAGESTKRIANEFGLSEEAVRAAVSWHQRAAA